MKPSYIRAELLALSERRAFKPRPKQIRSLRERTGLSTAEAASVLRVGRRTWLGWEKGERQMPQRDYELLLLLALCPEARAIFCKMRGLPPSSD